jgi:hypothetical protein
VETGKTTYSFEEAAEITGVAPIVVTDAVAAMSADATTLRLAPTNEPGGLCLERTGSAPSCTYEEASFHHLTWTSAATNPAPSHDNRTTSPDRVAIVVAPHVQVAFITVNVSCSRGEFPDVAQLWVCAAGRVARLHPGARSRPHPRRSAATADVTPHPHARTKPTRELPESIEPPRIPARFIETTDQMTQGNPVGHQWAILMATNGQNQ